MSAYTITFASSARKELRDLPAALVERLIRKIRALAEDPRPPGCRKLHGFKDRWRVRVGDYRIVYAIDDTARAVDITRIAHRRDVYEL